MPAFSRLQALKSIFLAGNSFSGDIPDNFFSGLSHLKKLWLSNNGFEGPIPSSLSKATNLMEIHLEGNHFAGAIPDLAIPSLTSLDVSSNKLSGPVSAGASSGSAGAAVGLVLLVVLVAGGAMAVASKRQKRAGFETLGVEQATAIEEEKREKKRSEAGGSVAAGGGSTKRGRRTGSSVKGSAGGGGGGAAELVMVNESKGVFGLQDLMRAAAEVMGNGGMGSAYKAVMANGVAVVVKRMKEMNRVGKETFEVEMRRLGRLNHPNVLPPLAYHYRKEEKLVISELVPKGSLLYILHGDRGADHAALNWPTRLKIIRGIARGMAYLHAELNSIDIPHGNLKSGNVLLADDFEPLLVDYGLLAFINPSHASQAMFAFKSPEILRDRHVSPKSDVYCLGIIVLELLSGKFPAQYLNNTKGGTDVVRWAGSVIAENQPASLLDPAITQGCKAEVPEMEGMVRVGAELIEADPDRRPDMKEAARRIEEVGAATEKRRRDSVGTTAVCHVELVREGQAAASPGGAGAAGDWAAVGRTGSITERSRSIGDNVSFAIS
ncbi:putative inactive leucine-rich repeat receptor-like protein kinase [Apostasia shenzhenica]|uniref:Putative inactive leucine-rich repeat receptor-like protein kinase n=1 Tax=Apostasia shenzhenica TaxID=1088818 RepID=A0A2H9ZUT2_9ASPA|nr:putative inactive leucine-rich repeat receptor-like protein kinase [Apostasia shenzhenica]